MSAKTILITTALSILLAGPLAAQEMKEHDHSAMQTGGSPSTKAFEDANAKMYKDMAIDYSGDPDVDFVRSMIPHHQGAIDMSNVVLKYGADPEVKALAEHIIADQQPEIDQMNAWLTARNIEPAAQK